MTSNHDGTTLCDVCGIAFDLNSDSSITANLARGLETLDDDSFTARYTISRKFCSEAHFHEWAARPIPEFTQWEDWSPDDDESKGGLTSCGWIALLGLLVCLPLMIVGAIAILQRLT